MAKKKTRRQRLAAAAVAAATAAAAHKELPSEASTTSPTPQHLQLDPRGDGLYSGTFRWLESKVFPRLPPFPHQSKATDRPLVDLSAGWQEFLASRSGSTASPTSKDLVAVATQDPSCLDALSFPVTLLHAIQLLNLRIGPELRVLVVGASQKAEQRVWRTTDYWSELAAYFPQTHVTLFFIGPEVLSEHDPSNRRDTTRTTSSPSNLIVRHFRGTFGDFQDSQQASDCTPETSLLVGYNTGFGNFLESQHHDLLFSWLPDLVRIAESRLPAIFTCANDYADMSGEFAVQTRVVGAQLLLLPKQNPFSAASHLHEDGQRDTKWSRANSFFYVVQGVDKTRHFHVKKDDVTALQQRLDADLDFHLQDALGRHFYQGMVLTKEQASRCKALNGTSQSTASAVAKMSVKTQCSRLETPVFQFIPGARDKEIVVVIHIPRVASTAERIAVDLTDSILTVLVPDKYLLKTALPFPVDKTAGSPRAELAPPLLRITLCRT